MSCAAPAARLHAGLRDFILSLPYPRRLARRVCDEHAPAGKALLLFLVLALLAVQLEVHAHALSHLPAPTQTVADAAANGAVPGEEEERHADAICLECLALAALELPPAAPKSFTFDNHGPASPPVTTPPVASACTPLRPRCRAPPSSSALRRLPR